MLPSALSAAPLLMAGIVVQRKMQVLARVARRRRGMHKLGQLGDFCILFYKPSPKDPGLHLDEDMARGS